MTGYTSLPLDDTVEKVRVINRNAFTIRDRYDGIPYEFPPGKQVMLLPEVATHILGYPGDVEDMHRHMAKRWGWNLMQHMQVGDDGLTVWQRQCLAIEVSMERFELRRVSTGGAIPADGDDIGTMSDTVPLERPKMTREDRSAKMKKIWADRRAKKEAEEQRKRERMRPTAVQSATEQPEPEPQEA